MLFVSHNREELILHFLGGLKIDPFVPGCKLFHSDKCLEPPKLGQAKVICVHDLF